MKLSNQQVNALAIKIKDELIKVNVTPIKDYNNEIYSSDEYINFIKVNSDCKYLQELNTKLNCSYYYFEQIQNLIKHNYFENKFKEIPKYSIEEITNEIHLATIDSIDLASLIESVSAKFK